MAKRLAQCQAAIQLNLSTRQIKRLVLTCHLWVQLCCNRNNKVNAPIMADEKLTEQHRLVVSVEALRQ